MNMKNVFPDVPERFHEKVNNSLEKIKNNEIEELKDMSNKNTNKGLLSKKARGLIAVAVACIVISSVPISAYIINSQDRLSSMSDNEKNELINEANMRQSEASSYSRKLTKKEEKRFIELQKEYQKQGKIPKKDLFKITSDTEINKDVVSYNIVSGVFNLPDRELNDEDILQIVDYGEKIIFAFEDKNKEYIEDQKKKLAELQAINVTNGGVTQDEAKRIISKWSENLGLIKEGSFDFEVLYSEEDYTGKEYIGDFDLANSKCKITINAQDGSLKSYCELLNNAIYSGEKVKNKKLSEIDQRYKQAKEILKTKFGYSAKIKEANANYIINKDGEIDLNLLRFYIKYADGKTVTLGLNYTDGMLMVYSISSDSKNYEEYFEEIKENAEFTKGKAVSIKLK